MVRKLASRTGSQTQKSQSEYNAGHATGTPKQLRGCAPFALGKGIERQGQGSALDPPKAGGLWKPLFFSRRQPLLNRSRSRTETREMIGNKWILKAPPLTGSKGGAVKGSNEPASVRWNASGGGALALLLRAQRWLHPSYSARPFFRVPLRSSASDRSCAGRFHPAGSPCCAHHDEAPAHADHPPHCRRRHGSPRPAPPDARRRGPHDIHRAQQPGRRLARPGVPRQPAGRHHHLGRLPAADPLQAQQHRLGERRRRRDPAGQRHGGDVPPQARPDVHRRLWRDDRRRREVLVRAHRPRGKRNPPTSRTG